MKQASFGELSNKEVINTSDCRRLGYITDLCIDLECGRIISFTVKPCTGFFPQKNNEICIPWENITKIGDDIIFVNICHAVASPPPPKKRFFN